MGKEARQVLYGPETRGSPGGGSGVDGVNRWARQMPHGEVAIIRLACLQIPNSAVCCKVPSSPKLSGRSRLGPASPLRPCGLALTRYICRRFRAKSNGLLFVLSGKHFCPFSTSCSKVYQIRPRAASIFERNINFQRTLGSLPPSGLFHLSPPTIPLGPLFSFVFPVVHLSCSRSIQQVHRYRH
jgi:hypothetical protein